MANVYDNAYVGKREQYEDSLINKYLLKHKILEGSVLDLGCGTGKVLEFKHNITEYYGIDLSKKMLKICRKRHQGLNDAFRHNVNLINGDMDNLETYPDMFSPVTKHIYKKKFDNVVSTYGSISYLKQPEKLPKILKKVLKTNGKAYLMGYGVRWGFGQNKTTETNGILSYRLLYTPEMLKGLFQDFKILEIRPLSVVLDRIPRILWGIESSMQTKMLRQGLYLGVLLQWQGKKSF